MRVAVVTGVGRRAGIGHAVAQRLRADGLTVLTHALEPGVADVQLDFAAADAPRRLIEHAVREHGRVDVLVANHARDGRQTLDELTAEELDACWAVNARASALLVQAFADVQGEDRRVVLFTSGQHLGPMADELPYAISKGAIHQMTRSLADAVADRGITVNAINPGPVDTGWPDDATRELLRPAFPAGRWGRPEDIAAVVAWLASVESGWVTGQVIDAEGGFRRTR
jgi:3-oxoacyl-[acyl-carrier protein] reductase